MGRRWMGVVEWAAMRVRATGTEFWRCDASVGAVRARGARREVRMMRLVEYMVFVFSIVGVGFLVIVEWDRSRSNFRLSSAVRLGRLIVEKCVRPYNSERQTSKQGKRKSKLDCSLLATCAVSSSFCAFPSD